MTHERIENRLIGEIAIDEHRYVARPIPATVEQARGELDAAPRMSLAVVLGAAAALAIVAVVAWAAWRSVEPEVPGVGAEPQTASAVPSPSATPPGPLACGARDLLGAQRK